MSDKPSWIERWPWLRWKNRPITPEEILQIEIAWLNYAQKNQYTYHKIEKRNDGVWVSLTPNSHLQIQPTRIAFHGEASKDDAAIIASLHHVQESWGGSFAVRGSDDFKMRSWAHAQVLGLKVTNYEPPKHMRAQASKLVEQIRAAQIAAEQAKEALRNKVPPASDGPGTGDNSSGTGSTGGRPRKYEGEKYVLPRNATSDFLVTLPTEVYAAASEVLEEIRKKNPVGEWPHEQYHYGMGRDMRYEMWLSRLSEEERRREIEAARRRYEAHYDREASALIAEMRARGFDVGGPSQKEPDHDSPIDENRPRRPRPPNRNGPEPDGPSLGGGRGR